MNSKIFLGAMTALIAMSGLSHTMVDASAKIAIDTRVGDLTFESSFYRNTTLDLWLSTRWDLGERGVLKVNGEEKLVLGASAETNHSLVVEANVAKVFE